MKLKNKILKLKYFIHLLFNKPSLHPCLYNFKNFDNCILYLIERFNNNLFCRQNHLFIRGNTICYLYTTI